MIALMYHDIDGPECPSEKTARRYVIAADMLRRHLDRIAAHKLAVMSLSAYHSGLALGTVESERTIVLTFDDGHVSTERVALPILVEYGMVGTTQVIAGFVGRDDRFTMTPEQMANLIRQGWDVGAHGLTHVVLPELDDQALQWELVESKRVLERHLGQPVDFMSVPHGPYNRRVRNAAVAAGYTAVLSSASGINSPGEDRHCLRRMIITRALELRDFEKVITQNRAYYAKERLRRSVFLMAQNVLGETRYRAIRKALLRNRA